MSRRKARAVSSHLTNREALATIMAYPYPGGLGEEQMQDSTKSDVLKRLNFIEGHLAGIRRMVESDKYCVDVLKQTYAVRRAIEKMEALMLDGHLHTCVVEGSREGGDDAVLWELVERDGLASG